MRYLVDTGILLRLFKRADPDCKAIRSALMRLITQRHALVISIQNAAGFWNVCTRPADARGGFGLTIEETARRLRRIELFLILPEQANTYTVWRNLVKSHAARGAKVHDARLVAWMITQSVTRVLTLNSADFARYPEIEATTPSAILNPA
jgi:predicted nucleic acid-binding protein